MKIPKQAWLPDLIYTGRQFESGLAIVCDDQGRIAKLARADALRDLHVVRLKNRALLPGMVNAHSHAFQRVLRGRAEYHAAAFRVRLSLDQAGSSPPLNREGDRSNFWTWRELMYSAARRLAPEDIYDASRMAFLEMILSGITAVGEFHYIHHAPDRRPYEDPNLIAKEVVRAARDVGLRIALLRVAYARAGYQTDPNPQQARFIEDCETYLENVESLIGDLSRGSSPTPGSPSGQSAWGGTVREGSSVHDDSGALPHGRANAPHPTAWVGVAPHSVRAVPLDYLREVVAYANERNLPTHMHVAEQPAEVSACIEEYGRTPVALLESEGLLSERFTGVHMIHITPKAVPVLARAGATVCACPTTERNLGDGVVPADEFFRHGVRVCLGTDSQAQIDLLEDARELEYHLRLQKLERAVLGGLSPGGRAQEAGGSSPTVREGVMPGGRTQEAGGSSLTVREGLAPSPHEASVLAARLFDCATMNGAASIGAPSGRLEPGRPADFFTVDLDDPSIAGSSPGDLLSGIVFSLQRSAVRDVVIAGNQIVTNGHHPEKEEIITGFARLQERLWG